MVRNVLAAFAGLATAMGTIAAGEFVVHLIYPLPAGVDPWDADAVNQAWMAAPLGAKVAVLVADGLGSLAGGLTIGLLARQHRTAFALALGAFLTAAAIANNLTIPPPKWFWIISVVEFIPAAYGGARLANYWQPTHTVAHV